MIREWPIAAFTDARYCAVSAGNVDSPPVMPVRVTSPHSLSDSALEDMEHFDEDRYSLEKRVSRFETEHAWAEDPPSRTRHMIHNVRVLAESGDELVVEANFHLYRTRLDSEEDSWIGRRRDRLRRVDGELRISERHVFLEQTVILSRNLSNFF